MSRGLVHLMEHLCRGVVGVRSQALVALVNAFSILALLAMVGRRLG